MTKLTLSVDEQVSKDAKQLARERGTSVSAMFSQFVRALARRGAERPPIGRLTRQASGLARLPKGKQDRDVLTDALLERHGLSK